ncbi:putative bifunctional diguanylate cyclase/phosphodiesterase [Comamonas endophytica]|uniref:Bifunctional diguanylate cyclase/phosphodiesterase n=1 Tax=Comamonas endophytica TaxID=2949090 RepID=A0ABY6G5I1_9BURK|nr:MULTISPECIES: bifunctional diguanylate cyclase/phosphodiesterase [unclassified Acidovorax]MCD2512401.1 bifunctional diguanylate cyclase/phosphodiesterase [Acidovorax sp. D4N7]UYG50151.1 bifunctional diguanylate cyclase/phosphodiesterase [Acidovorax sp. 5MLIR]
MNRKSPPSFQHAPPPAGERLPSLRLYAWLARFKRLNYQAKIMVMAFIGTHLPLLALTSWFALESTHDWSVLLHVLVITLAATLVGTAVTLLVLHHLLRPVAATAKALRVYREQRLKLALPTHFTDEAGALMADAHRALQHLDKTLESLQFIDDVTGLPNRKRFLENVQDRIAHGQPFAVAIVRIANLARIEETIDRGHAELAARSLAQRLERTGHFWDQLSRVGPSKFGCILHLNGKQDTWAASAARLRASLKLCAGELPLGELQFQPQLQGGLAVFPDDGAQADALLDAGIAAASLANPAQVMLHSVNARRQAIEQMQLEQDLRQALARSEFVLHYQPVFDLQAGRAIGAEALVRWQHPERGLVPPGAFIDTAESSGLIGPLGLWVIREACRQLGEWNRAGLPHMRMAINVSARQFLDPQLGQHLREAIAAAGISPDQLEIELTETVAMVDHAHTHRVFSALRSDGVGIAIDDFGTGYASMSYLRKLPFDKLKIDREFVTDVHRSREGQAICGALIELGKGLGLRVLAEGVEQKEEVRYLAQQGCDLFQGYYFARPVAAAQFEHSLMLPPALLHGAEARLMDPLGLV